MSQVFGTLLFFQQTFFEASCILCFRQYTSAEIPGHEVFSHPSWELKHFKEVFKVFCSVLMKEKPSDMVKMCFFNVLFQLLKKSIMTAFNHL